jgi:hypothetical protein
MTKPAYEETSVSVDRSQQQIRTLLKKFNVQAIRFTSYPSYAILEFVRQVSDKEFLPYRITVKPKVRDWARNTAGELDRAERQVWRVVYWWLKAKVEAIEFGLVEFEQDFLPYMILATPDGEDTVAHLLFERLAGHTSLPDDPFKGLRPKQITQGKGEAPEK